MSVFEQGLSEGFFGRWRAVAAGLAIAGITLIGFDLWTRMSRYVSEPKKAPMCYGSPQVAGKQSIPGRGARDGYGPGVDDRLGDFNPDKITLALRHCTSQSCPSAAWKEYSSAMFWYLSSRLQHTSDLYRRFGDDGLTRARLIYREPIDRLVEQGLRERYAAGIFRLNDFRQNRAAIAMIVLKGGEVLRPCRVGEPAEDD